MDRFAFVIFILSGLSGFTSALEITKVILEQREMSVPLGSGVMIPCSFSTNTPNVLPKTVSLEWRFKPEDSHLSTPILILITTMAEQELKLDDRAHVFEDLVIAGNCSLVIDHTFLSDSGTYQVYLSVDGVLFKESLRVELKVFGEEQTEDHTIRRMESKPRKYDDEEDVDQEILSFIQKYQQLKKSSMIYVILAFGGLIIIILIGGSVWGVYTMVQYFKLKKTVKDLMLRMEEGVSSYKDHQSIKEEENLSTSQTSSSADD